jgi:hypothetical protein
VIEVIGGPLDGAHASDHGARSEFVWIDSRHRVHEQPHARGFLYQRRRTADDALVYVFVQHFFDHCSCGNMQERVADVERCQLCGSLLEHSGKASA